MDLRSLRNSTTFLRVFLVLHAKVKCLLCARQKTSSVPPSSPASLTSKPLADVSLEKTF